MKKLFALLLAAVMLLCLFAGCNKQNETDNDEDDNNSPADPFVDSTPAGTLYLTFGPAIEIVFDENGKALQITGTNEAGKTIAAACQNQLNQECVFAARSLLRYASDNALIGDSKTVAVRLGKSDHMPKEDFMDTIITDCQYLCDEECTGLKMIRITEERLDEDGNLSIDCAKLLAAYYLNVDTVELEGGDAPVNGVYTLSAADGNRCTVNAFNGMVLPKLPD